ncbi:ferroxidase [Synchytrium microbalum]|uniref:ferroxidase n=1 Tax=Synchytrium microbalum TaxID=1806994 RepID=A0A507CBN9_9FUNG|nr:ferroxidase [Synchytrium microbalum]TPX37042.1 ferroxidase [Synchytrium microbalum]
MTARNAIWIAFSRALRALPRMNERPQRALALPLHPPLLQTSVVNCRSTIRTFSTDNKEDRHYHRVSDEYLDKLVEYFEAVGDETETKGYDIVYSDGVMTLKLGSAGTYVINKQPPNRQIWLSSPKSGPARFEYSDAKKLWLHVRTGQVLNEILDREIQELMKRDIQTPL